MQEDDNAWKSLLPVSRNPSGDPAEVSVSYGDYFCAICSFLEKDRFEMMAWAASQRIREEIRPEQLEKIDVYLEKHGEFYHPARIEILANGYHLAFVVNIAISDAGKDCIKKEYRLLKQLNNNFPYLFLPKIYDQTDVRINSSLTVPMFIGEWFEGYNEFHLSYDQADKKNKIRVWDTDHDHFFLSPAQAKDLYKQAAMILAAYYDIETFEQIYPWHHAAGDFVVKLHENNDIELKLITVRQYTSLVKNDNPDTESVLQAMLLFLLNLSIRMRLDRLDGVGDIVWADDIAAEGTLNGFFMAMTTRFPESLVAGFRKYLLSCTETDLADLSEAIVNTYDPMAPEVPVIKKHLKKHAAALHHAITHS
ncbi:Uncharacterized protein dnm_073390 [Desulfonema magnum]|uniref:Uncharacterized protein n=1 Tax=Desulfonema magnum TaxID=45655 RepID=A0A975GRT2_9BACT|nr:Uncharacterized protein dnm_073390 [Desulfonema magnum]